MDGRNASGRRISLLNDDEDWGYGHQHMSLPFHSRTSSASGQLPSDPPTPQLIRSDSTDSGALQRTPSPLTPTSTSSGSQFASHYYSSSDMYPYSSSQQKQPSMMIPPGYDIIQQPTADLQTSPPHSTPAKGRPSGPTAKDVPTQKNRYPCPVAKKYNCNDYFTTSGHAARHAKKHTGRKDSFCPECNKAFTRKDNMEQHRRTHQNGRKASKDIGAGDGKRLSKVSLVVDSSVHSTKRATPLAIQASMPIRDHSRSSAHSSYASYPDMLHAVPEPYPADHLGPSGYSSSPYPALSSRGLSGLDTLAYAASSDLRRSPPY